MPEISKSPTPLAGALLRVPFSWWLQRKPEEDPQPFSGAGGEIARGGGQGCAGWRHLMHWPGAKEPRPSMNGRPKTGGSKPLKGGGLVKPVCYKLGTPLGECQMIFQDKRPSISITLPHAIRMISQPSVYLLGAAPSGGFGLCGIPENLIAALKAQAGKDNCCEGHVS